MVSALLSVVYLFLHFIISLFPSGGLFPTSFHTASTTLAGYLHILDPLLPISTLLTCFLLIISIEISLLGFRGLRWILSYIPFIGGK